MPSPHFFMLNCLANKVTWWDGCGSKPQKLLLNNLPGMDIGIADWVTGEQKKSISEVLNSCIESAVNRTESEVRMFMQPQMSVMTAFSNITLGYISDSGKLRQPDGKMYGIRMKLGRSPSMALQINKVFFFPEIDGHGKVYIYDLLTGVEKDSFDVEFEGGKVNEYSLDLLENNVYRFDNQPVDVAIVMQTDVAVYNVELWAPSTCGLCTGRWSNEWVYANSVKIDPALPKIERNVKTAQHTGGLYINYNVICDISDYLCGISDGLKMAVWYAAGSAMMDEVIFSTRLNSATTVNKDDAIERKSFYESKYSEVMSLATENAVLPKSPCFVCNKTITAHSAIP